MGKKVTILGSTGSIGRQTLEVIAASNGEYEVLGISGDRNTALLAEQALRFRPRYVAAKTAMEPDGLPQGTELLCGSEGVCELAGAAEADIVVNGISGFAALRPLLAALKAGKRVALANKESVVCGKQLVDAALKANGGEIMPVDSEQSALFQCMNGGERREIRKLLLTASGGRFWNRPFAALAEITLEEALSHPTWNMGQKITIDSATLFNKGLEVIETSYLFDIPGERIEVLIHPQSVVHSLVEFCDGTVIGNLSVPDMRLPIQYALTYPSRPLADDCRLRMSVRWSFILRRRNVFLHFALRIERCARAARCLQCTTVQMKLRSSCSWNAGYGLPTSMRRSSMPWNVICLRRSIHSKRCLTPTGKRVLWSKLISVDNSIRKAGAAT